MFLVHCSFQSGGSAEKVQFLKAGTPSTRRCLWLESEAVEEGQGLASGRVYLAVGWTSFMVGFLLAIVIPVRSFALHPFSWWTTRPQMMLGIMLSCALVPRAVDVEMETGIGPDLGIDGLAAVSSVPLEASRIAPHVVAM